MRRAASLLLLLLASSGLHAQEADTLEAALLSSFRDMPVVRPSEETALSGRASTDNLHLAEAVSRFTGVQVKDYGGLGGLKTINVRSLGSEHVGVFIDGVQIDNAQNMQVDLGRLSIEGFGSLALYNAHKDVRLQTAREYASGASLHLTSSVPVEDRLRLRIRGGSFGTVNPSLTWDKCLGAVSVRASAEYLGSAGNYPYPYFDTTLVRENGDIRSLRAETQIYGRLKRGDWRLHLYGYGSERGFPGPVIRRAQGFPLSAERQTDLNVFVQGSWQQDWTDLYSTALRLKYANDYTHYDTHPEKNPMAIPYNLHFRQQSAYVSVAQSYTVCDGWSVDLSTDLQRNALDSDVGQNVAPRRTSFTGALAGRYVSDKLRLAAHIAYTGAYDGYANANAGGWSREDAWRDAWMPSASVAWLPVEWLEMDAFVKRSYRLPSFNDLYYSLMGNSSLKPESAFQTGVDLNLHAVCGVWSLEGRISPYFNCVDNKIVAIPTSSQFRWTMLNIGVADITGLDLKGCLRYSRNDFNSYCTLRYTFQRALDHSSPGSLTYGNQLPYIPLHSGSADLGINWKRWGFVWNTQFTGEKWSRSANTDDYRIAPWSVSYAALSWNCVKGRKLDMDVSLRLSNVFDYRYQIVQGYPMPGRSLLAGLLLSF